MLFDETNPFGVSGPAALQSSSPSAVYLNDELLPRARKREVIEMPEDGSKTFLEFPGDRRQAAGCLGPEWGSSPPEESSKPAARAGKALQEPDFALKRRLRGGDALPIRGHADHGSIANACPEKIFGA